MSLKLQGVQKLKALRPQWTGGLLAATSVGDITRLDADFLAVNQNMASPAFIRRAHKAGKRVFVWTVNDALSLSHWMSMGVDGVITDEPALARKILAQREKLSPAERLLREAEGLVTPFRLPEELGSLLGGRLEALVPLVLGLGFHEVEGGFVRHRRRRRRRRGARKHEENRRISSSESDETDESSA